MFNLRSLFYFLLIFFFLHFYIFVFILFIYFILFYFFIKDIHVLNIKTLHILWKTKIWFRKYKQRKYTLITARKNTFIQRMCYLVFSVFFLKGHKTTEIIWKCSDVAGKYLLSTHSLFLCCKSDFTGSSVSRLEHV